MTEYVNVNIRAFNHSVSRSFTHSKTSMFQSLIDANIMLLGQAQQLLQKMNDAQFTHFPKPAFQAGVGTHLRHCLDFYHAFLAGLPHGGVDYDARQRDPQIERDRDYANAKIEAIAQQLRQLPTLPDNAPLQVKVNDSGRGIMGHSSVSRELQALIEHTIHHYALMAVLLKLQGFDPGNAFGVAPSTLLHWQSHQPTQG